MLGNPVPELRILDVPNLGLSLLQLIHRLGERLLIGPYITPNIEVAELRPQLGNIIGLTGYPQLLLRLGYGPEVPPTPRRHISEVLME